MEDALVNIENTFSYYAGGTLSVSLGTDRSGKQRGICLNLNGKGFVLSNLKNTTIYVPEYITKMVQDIYLKYKGESDHYLSIVKQDK